MTFFILALLHARGINNGRGWL